MKKLFIMGMVLGAFMTNSYAGTIVLKQDEGDTVSSIFKLGVVAKITRDLQVLISNDGFTSPAAEVNPSGAVEAIEQQTFAFGHSVALPTDAEDYLINPLLSSGLSDHVCGVSASVEAQSIQKLVAGSLSSAGAVVPGSCGIATAGGINTVSAAFSAQYEVKAAGGITGIFAVTAEDGIEADLLTLNAAKAFLTSSISLGSLDADGSGDLIIAPGAAGEAYDLSKGKIDYAVSFDLNGPLAKKESRVSFKHILAVD